MRLFTLVSLSTILTCFCFAVSHHKIKSPAFFDDSEREARKARNTYTIELHVGELFAVVLPQHTGVSGVHSFVEESPAWMNLTEEGILYGKPEIGGKEEVLVGVQKEDTLTVYWLVFPIHPIEPSIGGFIKVPAGSFYMGSPKNEGGRDTDEVRHKITLTQSFEIQTTEVTQAQWYQVMKQNPSYFNEEEYCSEEYVEKNGVGLCPKHPVEGISWHDAQSFIRKMNAQDEVYHYRLPTEAEWEYAARGKSQTAYSFGPDSVDLVHYGWYGDNSGGQTRPVGTKKPNPLGLYDVHGNVWEWVEDAYQEDLGTSEQTNPLILTGWYRVLRGGGYLFGDRNARSANRYQTPPDIRTDRYGVRLVRILKN